ncbi:T9SS type A sorting domain-containing protein [Hymenobacter ruricola]
MYQIGQGGIVNLGTVTGLVNNIQVASGVIDRNGNYYVSSQNSAANGTDDYNIYRFNLNAAGAAARAATALRMRNAANTANADLTFYDLALNPVDNKLYGVFTDGTLWSIDPTSVANRALVTTISNVSTNNDPVGTASFDVAGNLFVYTNGNVNNANSGSFYEVDLATGTYNLISNIDPASVSDGASCINPSQRIDVVKELVSIVRQSATQYDIKFNVRVKNTATSTATNVQVTDFLRSGTAAAAASTAFPNATSVVLRPGSTVTNYPATGSTVAPTLAFNANFTGQTTNADLLTGGRSLTAGQSALISFTVRVTFPAAPTTVNYNTAYASSISGTAADQGHILLPNGTIIPPGNLLAEDKSTDGSALPETPNEDAPSPTPIAFTPGIIGNVFEDIDYGGGLGRSQLNSTGQGVVARVELYNAQNNQYIYATNANAAGTYSFVNGQNGLPAGTITSNTQYKVRVVNNTVVSGRTGGIAGLYPVQTFVSDGVTEFTNRVGGAAPGETDYGSRTTNLPNSNASAVNEIQSIVTVTTPASGPLLGVDFGFSFDVIVNNNDSGQGSLRQFITNSNALGDEAGITQKYTATGGATTALPTGRENAVFMLPNGSAVAGQAAGLPTDFAGTTSTITLASALPAITGPLTVIDGNTQANSTGNNTPVVTTAGSESTGPEIVLNLNGFTGLAFSGANEALRNLTITGSQAASSGVLVNGTATGLTIASNTIYNNGVNVTLLNGASGTTISSNVIRNSTRANGGGIVAQSGTSTNTFSQNIFGGNNGLAIDLTNGTTTSGDGVTLNDNGDADTGANGLLNFPVITSATISGTNLIVAGYARGSSSIELYKAAVDPTGFGEGQTYLTTVTEGVADIDTRSGLSYSGLINGLNQGSDNSASGFIISIPLSSLPGGTLSAGTVLTSTATLSNATSEFSGNVKVNLAPVANNVTNDALPTNSPATVLSPNLSATADGAGNDIILYQVYAPATGGTLVFNGTTVPATGLNINANQLNLLTFQPTSGFTGNATFNYLAFDLNGVSSNTATYTIPVTAVANVATTISGAAPNAGGTLNLTATFRNLGPNDATGVTRFVQLPAGLTTAGATVTSTAGATYNNVTGLIAYTTPVATLASGSTAQDVTVTIANLPASYANFTAVSRIATTSDENGATANNVSSLSLAVTPQSDLTTSLTGQTVVSYKNLATFIVTTRNNGISPAGAAVQTVQLPTNLSGVFATNGGTYNSSNGRVTFPAVPLTIGQVVTNSISFSAPDVGFSPSALVTLTSATDTNPGNNTAYLNGAASATSVGIGTPSGTGTNLYTTVTGPSQVAAGGPATYTVTQGNRGPLAAANVQSQVMLPTGQTTLTMTLDGNGGTLNGTTITYPSGATYSQTTGVLLLPNIPSQSIAATTSYSIVLEAPKSGTSFAVSTNVVSTSYDLVPADNVATVETEIQPVTDVAISIFNTRVQGGVAATNNETAGQTVTYGVQTVNNSTTTAQDVRQVVNLSTGFDPATLQVNGLTGTVGATTVTFASGAVYTIATGALTLPAITSLVGNGTAFTSVSYVVQGSGPVRAAAQVSTTTTESSLTNNASQFNAPNGNGVTLAVDATVAIAGPAQAVVGNPVLYTVTTANNGPSTTGTTATSLVLPANLAPATLLLNNAAGIYDNVNTVVFTNGSTYTRSTGALTAPTVSPNLTRDGEPGTSFTVQFITPDVTLLRVTAAVTSSATDVNSANNTAQVITPLFTSDLTALDLVTGLTGPATPVAGSTGRFTVTTTNGTVQAATNVMQTVSLPSGLLNNGGSVVVSGNGSYNNLTGVVTIPATPSLATSGVITNTIDVTLPGTAFTATATTALNNPDTDPTNNTKTVAVTPANRADVTTAISGPASAMAGAQVSYAVVTTNNGPSAAGGTTQTLTLPAGVTSYSINGGAAISGSGTVTIRTASTLNSGVSETVVVSFTAPSANFTVRADVATSTTEPAVNASNTASVPTSVINQRPVAYDVVNTSLAPEGNTADRQPISPFVVTDAESAVINSFQLVSIPNAGTQGTLYYNNGGTFTAITATNFSTLNLTLTQMQSLSFDPLASYVGSVAFTYTGTDPQGGVSNVATYTLAVGQDVNSVYTRTATKGGNANKYAVGDVLAFGIDINGAQYNTAGLIYDTNTGKAPATGTGAVSNGIMSASISASDVTLLGTYGIEFVTTTGQFKVLDPTKLPRLGITLPAITVTTIDTKGGTNTNTVTITTGAVPLPVELKEFTATAVKNLDAALTWATASEKNNDHFNVERSLNGTDFVKIAQVKGQGSTSAATSYALTDAGIGNKVSGLVYYRLQQVDADGTATYSPVRTVAFTKGAVEPAISLAPNPAAGSTQLDLTALPAGTYQVSVLDATGRVVLSAAHTAGMAHALDLNTIASGTYVVLVRGQNGTNLTKRLIKE